MYTKFVPVVAEKILIQNIATKYGSWLNIFASRDVMLTSMCHGYKIDSLKWCCLSLPCSDGEKFGSLMTNF